MRGLVAAGLGRELYRMGAELPRPPPAEIGTLSRLWQRASLLRPLALYLDTHNLERAAEGLSHSLRRFFVHAHGLVFLGTRELWSNLGISHLVVEVNKPTPSEQERVWAVALADAAGDSPAALAGQFNLDVGTIHAIARNADHEKPRGAGRLMHDRRYGRPEG